MNKDEVHFEALKSALRQSKDGIVLSLVIHPSDVDAGILSDPIGSRYQVTVVRIGDDEKPVQRSELNVVYPPGSSMHDDGIVVTQKKQAEAVAVVGEKINYSHQESALRQAQRAMVAQSGYLCRDKNFQRWMFSSGRAFDESERGAIEGLHAALGIKSRTMLASSERARRLFIDLRKQYEQAMLGGSRSADEKK